MTTNKTKPAKWPEDNLYLRGFSLFKSGRYKEAVDHFRMVTLLHPTVAAYWVSLGHALRRNKELIEAIECYKVALLLGLNEDADLLHSLAECFKDSGKDTEALLSIQEAQKFAKPELKYRLALIEKNWCNKDLYEP